MSSNTRTSTAALVCFCLLLNTACTTTASRATADARSGERAIKQGDKVTVVLMSGDRFELVVVENQDDHFIGTDEFGNGETIYWDDVHSIDVTVVSVVKTAAAAPLVVAGVAIALAVVIVGGIFAILGGGL